MTALATLNAAFAAGVVVALDGDALVLSAERKPNPDLLDAIRFHKAAIVALLLSEPVWSEEDWQAWFDERAGILEYDGGLGREQAEALATEELELFRLLDDHPASLCHDHRDHRARQSHG